MVWGGEFGRTVYSQGTLTPRKTTAATTIRAASPCGSPAAVCARATCTVRPDAFGYNIERDAGVTYTTCTRRLLHLLGFDHERLVHRHQGRDFRLTDVYGRVVRELLA